ncbi:MAG: PAS domain-containing sensor histidine kinase [Waddliaceae bacterium]
MSALFFRYFFLESFHEYANNIEKLDVSGKINQLYRTYEVKIGGEEGEKFKEDVESVLSTEWQRNMAADVFKKEISLYSKFIFIFLVIGVLGLFFILFNRVSNPLRRLQIATEALSKGNWSIRVKESKFSPLNDLITSFNRMAEELESNREKLIQAEKEMVWREMARVMAHEIKNPLTPITLSLERLESKFQSGSKNYEKVFQDTTRVIHEEIDNLQALASEFSEFARLPKATIAPYDLGEQLRKLILPYQDQAIFHLKLSNDLPLFYADRIQIKQILVNMIQNAIQSSCKDCTIQITTSLANGQIKITLTDNGSGIPQEDIKKIFDPYFSTREKGTGLGLAIVKRIVEQHGGTITVDSELGRATTFTLFFPNRDREGKEAT